MKNQNITVSEAFELREWSRVPTNYADLRKKVSTIPISISIPWDDIQDAVIDKLLELFDLEILGLWVAGLKKCKEIEEYADLSKHPRGELNEVALCEHELCSAHRPALEITVNGTPAKRLELDLNCSLVFEGAVLEIQDGRIKRVRFGDCEGLVTLECGGIPLVMAEAQKIRLGEMEPSEDVRIS